MGRKKGSLNKEKRTDTLVSQTIDIKTKLNEGIDSIAGGGKEVLHYRFKTGPRSLIKAVRILNEHRREMKEGFGNIGCGKSWIEINGKMLDSTDKLEIESFDDWKKDKVNGCSGYLDMTKTEFVNKIIKDRYSSIEKEEPAVPQ